MGRRAAGHARRRRGVRAGRGHGRDGLHLLAPRGDPAQQLAHQPAHARGRADQRRAAIPVHARRPASTPSTGRPKPTWCRSRRATPTRPSRRTPTAGRSCSPSCLCSYYAGEYPMETRIVRFHNIYGPLRHVRRRPGEGPGGDLPQGRARRATAAAIEIWGDGEQTRSFCYIDDCVEGIYRLMQSDYAEPLNLGTGRDGVDQRSWRDIVAEVAGKRDIGLKHVAGPAGRAGPQLRQLAAARGPRVGADDVPPRRAPPHLPVDREEADQR